MGDISISAGAAATLSAQRVGLLGSPVVIQAANLSLTNVRVQAQPAADGTDLFVSIDGMLRVLDSSMENVGNINSGIMTISAGTILMDGEHTATFTGVSSSSFLGVGGNIAVTCKTLSLINGAEIDASSSALSNAPGGNVSVVASESITLDGHGSDSPFPTGIRARSATDSNSEGGGPAGNLDIMTPVLSIRTGAAITVSTSSPSPGGDLFLQARTINIDGGDHPLIFTGISAQSGSAVDTGKGGDIVISPEDSGILNISLTHAGRISATTFGPADGGSININATSVELSSAGRIDSGSIYVPAGVNFPTRDPTGTGGSISIRAGAITLPEWKYHYRPGCQGGCWDYLSFQREPSPHYQQFGHHECSFEWRQS